MRSPVTKRWRLLRACVFAGVASQLAALGHVWAGGALPDPALLIVVSVVLGGAVTGLTRRRRTFPEILAALVAAQLAFHVMVEATAHHVDHVDDARMVVFHLVAALGSAWVMTAGESSLFKLFAAVHRVLVGRALRPRVLDQPSWTVKTAEQSNPLRESGVLTSVSRRGPPVAA